MFFMTFPAWTSTAAIVMGMGEAHRYGLLLTAKFVGPESRAAYNRVNHQDRGDSPGDLLHWDCGCYPRFMLGKPMTPDIF